MRKLLWFTIGFAFSCIIGVYLIAGSISLMLALVAVAATLCLYILDVKHGKLMATILIGFALGSAWIWLYNTCYLQTAKDYDGKTVSTKIEITDYSYEAGYGIAAEGRIRIEAKSFRTIVYLGDIDPVMPGDHLEGRFRLRLTTGEGQEEATYHRGDGIFLLAYADGHLLVDAAEEIPTIHFTAKLRQSIIRVLQDVFPEDTFGFAKALLLGDSSDLSYEVDTAFKISGIRHIIAISGLHVAILFSLVYTLAGKHRVLTAAVGIPVLVLFAAVAGFTPSIVRACIMQVLMMLAMLAKQEYDPPTALAFAVLVILGINPMAITSVSFQLSVGCVIGIFLLNKPISSYIMEKIGNYTGKSLRARLIRLFAGNISVGVSAMVLTMPLTACYFGMVSIVGILTNVLTLWAVSLVFYGIMLACGFALIWLPLGKLVAGLISWVVRYILFVAKTLAALPLASIYTCSVYTIIFIVVCYVLIGTFLLSGKRRPGLLIAAIIICLLVSTFASYIEPRLDNVRVTVFDVGQGQSVLLQSKGKNYLVDCGGDDSERVADRVAASLRSQGITRLDGIILTHYDTDHAGGVLPLLTQISTDKLYLPYITDDTDTKEALKEHYKDKIDWVRENTLLSGDFGKLTLVPGEIGADENESGLCILFQGENCDILITGDRSTVGEASLMERIALPQLELLVVGHHGSDSSTGFPLLSKTMPTTAVISVGKDNAYGHPAQGVLTRLEAFGTRVLCTDEEGTIVFRGR